MSDENARPSCVGERWPTAFALTAWRRFFYDRRLIEPGETFVIEYLGDALKLAQLGLAGVVDLPLD